MPDGVRFACYVSFILFHCLHFAALPLQHHHHRLHHVGVVVHRLHRCRSVVADLKRQSWFTHHSTWPRNLDQVEGLYWVSSLHLRDKAPLVAPTADHDSSYDIHQGLASSSRAWT
jgi:hypothetical protein